MVLVKKHFDSHAVVFSCFLEATESLIKAVYTLYQQRGLLLPVRSLLLKFFSKIYQKEELRSYRIRYSSFVILLFFFLPGYFVI